MHKCRIKSVYFQSGFVLAALFLALVWWSHSYEIRPAGIVIHHSALVGFPNDGSVDASIIDKVHQDRGFRAFYGGRFYHVGYHYVILKDGKVQQGRPETCRGAHTYGYNNYLGICLVGNFSSRSNPSGENGLTRPTAAQMNSLRTLCRRLMGKYQIPVTKIYRHCDLDKDTECPGDRFPFQEFLTCLVRAKSSHGSAPIHKFGNVSVSFDRHPEGDHSGRM